MEAQQDERTESRPYGEGFRQGVSRVLEELEKLTFIPKNVHERLTANAAKLCLAEAIAEKQAEELKQRAIKEWRSQAPELKQSAERIAREAAVALKRLFPNAPSGGGSSAQVSTDEAGKPEA